ncbi:MAG: hypothetical protein E7182_02720 [Erysipelotrichaceae bacterium]|nr:hypothetical protein [Erysipelotrichaceae bacterium]
MERKTKFSIVAVALSCTALISCLAAVGLKRALPIDAGSTEKTLTLTSEDLKKIELKDYEIGTKGPDKKFSIVTGEKTYIDGAFIFTDCGHQSVGETLGDPFQIDNTYEGAVSNAYNFNILFSFQHVLSMSAEVTITVKDVGVESSVIEVKFMRINDEFYTTIEDPEVYDKIVNLGGINDSPFDDWESVSFDLDDATTEASVDEEPAEENMNLAAFQFTYSDTNFVCVNNVITCTLTSLSFTYSCN